MGEDSAEKGLSLLVQQVLGRPLDKTEQLSNWNKRPLRPSQVRYAGEEAGVWAAGELKVEWGRRRQCACIF